MKKKVWIFNHHANLMFFDNGGRHFNFAKYLKRKGYEPVIFCSNAVHGTGELYFDNFSIWKECVNEVIDVPFIFIKGRPYAGNGKDRVLCMLDYYINVKKAAREYAKMNGNPDIIIGSSVHPLAVLAAEKMAKRYRVPSICEIRDLWPESIFAYMPEKKDKWYATLLYSGEKYLYKKADSIIMTWPGGKDYIDEHNWFKSAELEKVHYISNGVDLEVFQTNILGYNSKTNKSKMFRIVYTGSIRKVNNLRVLTEAAKLLKNWGRDDIVIDIYGDGDERAELIDLCNRGGLNNICFKGRIPKNDVSKVLSESNCTIMHNTSTILDKYGQSQNKFFEYLAAGKPILMTYGVGYSICKAEGCGIEVVKQSPENIARAMIDLADLDAAKYQAMCKASLTTAQKYSFEELTGKLISLIESI